MISTRSNQPLVAPLRFGPLVPLLLIGLMAATRYHHFGSATYLPDASLAVFLLAGFYLRSPWMFLLLLGEAALIDYLAIAGGVSGWCFTPAYWFLLPTYGVLWLGGRAYRGLHRWSWAALLPLAAILFGSVSVEFILSNASFYLLSGYFPEMSLSEYASRVAQYFPLYVMSACLYIAVAAVLHAALRVRGMRAGHHRTNPQVDSAGPA